MDLISCRYELLCYTARFAHEHPRPRYYARLYGDKERYYALLEPLSLEDIARAKNIADYLQIPEWISMAFGLELSTGNPKILEELAPLDTKAWVALGDIDGIKTHLAGDLEHSTIRCIEIAIQYHAGIDILELFASLPGFQYREVSRPLLVTAVKNAIRNNDLSILRWMARRLAPETFTAPALGAANTIYCHAIRDAEAVPGLIPFLQETGIPFSQQEVWACYTNRESGSLETLKCAAALKSDLYIDIPLISAACHKFDIAALKWFDEYPMHAHITPNDITMIYQFSISRVYHPNRATKLAAVVRWLDNHCAAPAQVGARIPRQYCFIDEDIPVLIYTGDLELITHFHKRGYGPGMFSVAVAARIARPDIVAVIEGY